MIFDIIGSIFQATVPLSHIGNQQVLNETLRILVEISWEFDFTFKNLLINSHGIVIVKWVNACYYLISQNSKRPPIDGLAVTLIK